ncbi:hemolysin III [Paucilactobacillus hokkaidonensis JCM 18461]|uniref:Hemolysin III n=2 Tax=Paucilactobacillus hokkaidonensis TaxID=1193095 RepID=A0A0A1GYY2_9LACO|nr:hemolysin III family protein [Paucilactobacillus hokkaidonensis]KRO10679.1 hemolysin III [Paucilactobacillus hokkaidonensis]BAP85671.1 hemolysin III [Paucilactobacillus hokkaidonensis JCM 18461]
MQPSKTRKNIIIELANTISHGLGVALAIAGLILLIIKAISTSDPMRIVTFSFYGSILILFYLTSTMFHALVFTRAHHVFQVFDHCMIFVLIGATYTPYCLVSISGWFGWTLFGVIWLMAICGIIYKSIWLNKVTPLSTIIYIIMGWMCVLAFKPLWHALTPVGFFLLLAGGLSFTLGALVYSKKGFIYAHLIWHFFVLAGTILMYFSILLFV